MKTVAANGANIPCLGLGTWELRDELCSELVAHAIDTGYRHVDTAQLYGNEIEVGHGVRHSDVAREDVFVTSKVWPDHFAEADFARAVDERLRLLDVGPLDLLLLHWPSRVVPLRETIRALNTAHRQGLARHIGISNFNVAMIEESVALSDAPLACNQVEYHPLINQDKVMAACRRHGLAVVAYCPIARGQVAMQPVITRIAEAHGASPAQVTLAWLTQQDGVVAIPRSARVARLAENLAATRLDLSGAEMADISALKANNRRLVSPESVAPKWDS